MSLVSKANHHNFMENDGDNEDDSTNVRVALRIRPSQAKEIIEGCQKCTEVLPGENQVQIGTTHAFTYDFVFDTDVLQVQIFELIQPLLDGTLRGYNATILAYGQTGSGKTYTMGTGFDLNINLADINIEVGIIPRAVDYLFSRIDEIKHQQLENNKPVAEFKITAQFIELYNEEVIDLIEHKGNNRSTDKIKIHEDINGQIYLNGVSTKEVKNAQETLECLRNGALCRTTACTNMNDQSSRSHAIFSLFINQRRFVMVENGDEESGDKATPDFESLSAKFHFVDLAGSERLKRTLAEGTRVKEAISINSGLLALGNVISALGDTQRASGAKNHVPYRDSKLTRLLQDSLGGNSPPCDRDFVETLNTLKYANRARNIKNKVVINQDKSSRTIALLKLEITNLKLELLDYKQGKRTANSNNDDSISDTYNENLVLHSELNHIREKLKSMQEAIDILNTKNAELLAEKHFMMATQNEDKGILGNGNEESAEFNFVVNYLKEIEDLRSKILEMSSENARLRSKVLIMSPANSRPVTAESVIKSAREEIVRDRGLILSRSKHRIEFENSHSENENSDIEEEDGNNGDSENDQQNDDELDENGELNEQLLELNNEITTKQQLIEQLEVSQKRMDMMKSTYEEKLSLLVNKIKITEDERDKMLGTFKDSSTSSNNAKSKIRMDYEKKLKDMESELGRLKQLQKDHNRAMKNNSLNEKTIAKLRGELDLMKKTKVKLMNQVRDDNIKARDQENKRMREIAQLKKDQRKKDIAIKNYESSVRVKDQILKRKHEEVNHLKKQANLRSKASMLKKSPLKAKNVWTKLKSSLTKNLTVKQTSTHLENEMESLIFDRDQIVKEMNELANMREAKLEDSNEMSTIESDLDEADFLNLKDNLQYVEDKIKQLQAEIVQLEVNEELNPNLINGLNISDMSYLINKMYSESFAKSYEDASIRRKLDEFEVDNSTLKKENQTLTDLLSFVIQKNPELYQENEELVSNLKRNHDNFLQPLDRAPAIRSSARKARRLTSTPQELLLGNTNKELSNGTSSSSANSTGSGPTGYPGTGRLMIRRNTFIVPQPPQPNSARPSIHASTSTSSSTSSTSRPFSNHNQRLNKNNNLNNNNNDLFDTTFIKDDDLREDLTSQTFNLPASPSLSRRNVFDRLVPTSDENQMTNSMIITNNNITKNFRSASAHQQNNNSSSVSLRSTGSAEGHTKSVLALILNNNELISSSKDSTIKVWDLQKKIIKCDITFSHSSPVQCISLVDENLLIASSGSIIKAYDLRMKNLPNDMCIKTMFSSGSKGVNLSEKNQSLEYNINAMAVNQNKLFTTYNERIRLWDIRKFHSLGLLAGKHGSAIMALVADSNRLVSGSKDHYIKVYDFTLSQAMEPIIPKILEPPHYSGIESLLLVQDTLYSGSRDNCIKNWNLGHQGRYELSYSLNNAHTHWITGMCMFNEYIVSSCRDGWLKIWNHSFDESGRYPKKELNKIEAHKGGVFSLASNDSTLFTGSPSGQIKFWRLCRNFKRRTSPSPINKVMSSSTGYLTMLNF